MTEAEPRRRIFFAISLLIPVLFFVVLEVCLRLFNYGYDYTQWVNPTKGKYVLNPDIAHKYFHNMKNVPTSDGDIFDEVKKSNAFRIFVLGESSGAGYPFLPTGSFSRYLQHRLQLVYPESHIEVVNCSMTAINSYAMRDLFPGILREKPDLVLIYAGHNEYYGALGVGSMESLGGSRWIVNTVIWLEGFKTFQLVRNVIASLASAIGGDENRPSGTLMARMAKDQYIGYRSKVYEDGIKQFKGNLNDILHMASSNGVRVILGTLACNLKDQPPFVSVPELGLPAAEHVYQDARRALALEDWVAADSLFRYAKDLDALRFRAPSKINDVIKTLAAEYNDPVVNIDSTFDAMSPDHVVGDNLMTDHLHPTLQGYQRIGDLFYREMETRDWLPETKPLTMSDRQQDSITVVDFPFGRLDSTIARYRIALLKNDWPYIAKDKKVPDGQLLQPRDHIDSLAFMLVMDRTNWDIAQQKAADWYASRNEVADFGRTMNALIDQYPIVMEYYDNAATTLLEKRAYDAAYTFLSRRNDIEPSALSTKWLGTLNLYKNRPADAEKYLKQSIALSDKDPQAWYNLSGVYVQEKDYRKALETVERALSLNPGYRDALALKERLAAATK